MSRIKEGELYFQHFSFRTGYVLDLIDDIEFIENKFNFIVNPHKNVGRGVKSINIWYCGYCEETIESNYKDIIYNGLKCTDCGNGSSEGVEERKWEGRMFNCLVCNEEHTFAILCGTHYKKAHRSDVNVVAHEYRRATRRMVLDSGWKPSDILKSGLFPCHVCGVENMPPKTIRSHHEHNHPELDITQFKYDFYESLGLERLKCTWCGKPTEIKKKGIGYATMHHECREAHRRKDVTMAVGIRDSCGRPIDEDGNIVSEDELRYPTD